MRVVDLMLEHYSLNALGPLRVVSALADNLGKGSRVGIATSRMGSIGDNRSGRMYDLRSFLRPRQDSKLRRTF